ncbi:MAG TPA: 50S ribosomal protein L23 [Opitutaceae bacterium]|jgi:large subunit ribosomal protein L23|nr:50S ribosomal protein L23 [Opitutaceae bacterium]
MNHFEVITGPLVTEKSQLRKDNERTLCFRVQPGATKTDIKNAVQAIFKVKVESVRTANFPGKMRRRGKYAGYRPDWKKAYVKLREGEKMVEYAQI